MSRINVPSTYEERKAFGEGVAIARSIVAMSVWGLSRKINEAESWVKKVELGMVRISRDDVDAFHKSLPHLHRHVQYEKPTP